MVSSHACLAATFGENDLNENKLCDFEEFVGVLSSLGLPMSDVQARQAFAECDVKRRGEVDFNEFLIWWGENENKMRAAHHDESMADVARDALTRLSTVEVAITQLQRDMREALELVGAAST
jgi:Ca2+-binding EF-hand superfamily protein